MVTQGLPVGVVVLVAAMGGLLPAASASPALPSDPDAGLAPEVIHTTDIIFPFPCGIVCVNICQIQLNLFFCHNLIDIPVLPLLEETCGDAVGRETCAPPFDPVHQACRVVPFGWCGY